MKLLPRRTARTDRPAKPARPHDVSSAWSLIKTTFSQYRRGWRRYALIVLVIGLPLSLININGSTDRGINAYTNIALLILNVALLWAAVEHRKSDEAPRLGRAYYGSSQYLIPLLVVLFYIVLMLIPFTIGLVLYAAGSMSQDGSTTLTEQLLVGLVALLLAAPSFYLLVRYGQAPIVAIAENLRPLAALRRSRQLTLGRFWRVFGRLAALLLTVFILSLPIAALMALLTLLKLTGLAAFLFGLITSIIVLPVSALYLVNLYHSLTAPSEAAA